MNKTTRYEHEQILGKDYPITNQISAEEILELQEYPPMKLPKFSRLCNQVLGILLSVETRPGGAGSAPMAVTQEAQ